MKNASLFVAMAALAVVAMGPSASRAAEQQLNPKAISIKLPDQIPWKRNEAGTNETAVLAGDPEKPGIYVEMLKWLPGNMSRPHWHPNNRYITVLKGTWWVGPVTPSRRTPRFRCRPAAMSRISPRKCIMTAPRTVRLGC